jgi:hypothetical protein
MNTLTYTIATILVSAFILGSLITAPAIQMSFAKSSGTATGDSGKTGGDGQAKHSDSGGKPATANTPAHKPSDGVGMPPTIIEKAPPAPPPTGHDPHDDGCTDAGSNKCPPGGPEPFPFPKLPKNCHVTSPDHILCIVHGKTIVKHETTTRVINQAGQIQTVNFKETLTSKGHNVALAAPTKKFIDSVGTLHIVGQIKNISTKSLHITAMTAKVSASGTVLGVAATLPTPKDITAGQSSAFEFVIGGINGQLVDLAQYFVS